MFCLIELPWYLVSQISPVGFPGVQIGTHVNDWNLDAPDLRPVFAVSNSVEDLDSVLFH